MKKLMGGVNGHSIRPSHKGPLEKKSESHIPERGLGMRRKGRQT